MEGSVLTNLSATFTEIIAMIGDVIDALLSSSGGWAAILPWFTVGIAVSLVLLGVKVISGLVWGH